ncbi:MAG: ATP-grasp domain-containing protein [Candidatus Omnitrophica bacterium]|nr:ATP-grasp domain-containing protein [Candidatus Omnitrophota bacterium]MBU1869773.1 ATP-grasp domain-containing protein [Candidatus Omnitrophota bacterium]
MKIALTYNLKEKDESKPPDYFSEFDSEATVNSITSAIGKIGHQVLGVNVSKSDLFTYFKKNPVDMVFNIAEGKHGRFRESEVPAVLDYLNIPYTGSSSFSLALALNKALTKKILKAENIPTPNFQVFSKGSEEMDIDLKFPLIVKPNCEGSAKGINKHNVVTNKADLLQVVKETIKLYNQQALVEEFIEGKELTVGVLENGKCKTLPILEIDFENCKQSGEYFYSWRMKEYQGNTALGLVPVFHCPARLDKEVEERVKDVVLKTHRAVGCLDISRTDIRLDKNNVPYVLEINPLPGLDPKESNFPIMAYAAGMKYEELIEAIIKSASERTGFN